MPHRGFCGGKAAAKTPRKAFSPFPSLTEVMHGCLAQLDIRLRLTLRDHREAENLLSTSYATGDAEGVFRA